jgi:hypothetical protein
MVCALFKRKFILIRRDSHSVIKQCILVLDLLMKKILKPPNKNRKVKKSLILMKNSVCIILRFCVIETDVASRAGMGMLVI